MISERKFAESYTSFWREMLPTGDDYLRKLNLQLERFAPPLSSNISTNLRGFINELAFRLYCLSLSSGTQRKKASKPIIEQAQKITFRYIARFRDSNKKVLNNISQKEINESLLLLNRLNKFFTEKSCNAEIICFPQFSGCGQITSCEGDVLIHTTLYEVKAGDRAFRLIDFKQLFVYCALNHASPRYQILNLCLVNPRVGVFFNDSVDNIAVAMSGGSPSNLWNEIIEFVSKPVGSI